MNSAKQMIGSLFIGAMMASSIAFGSRALAAEVRYIYYPPAEVYYDPIEKNYYYRDNSVWVERTVAPVGINLGKGVSVTLGGTTPYVYHETVVKQYPKTYIIKED